MVIQRSWKILSDVGSSGNSGMASSHDSEERSPAAPMHASTSSSDDSDCSNQTTHSMDTRVASPMTTMTDKKDSSDSADTTAATMMLPLLSEPVEPVIKYVTTSEMAETMLQRIRQRLSGAKHLESGGSNESAMRALELLRIGVQRSFDQELNEVIKRYMDDYFKPAFGNIKENLGEHAVSEEMLQKMSCALLENAKGQYTNFPRQQRQAIASPMASMEQQRLALKRPAASGKLSTQLNEFGSGNKLHASGQLGKPMPVLVQQQQPLPTQPQQPQQQTQQQPQQALQQTQSQSQQRPPIAPIVGGTLPTPVRRQIFWNTAQISTSTKFVLDVQANLSFGFGTDGKERLASKHPELIRYLPDAEDRDWLATRGIIPSENRSSRFLFLIYDEVCRLQQTHELYRHKTSIDLSMMLTFNVTEPMIQKMKLFFVDLNIKSRGLITNSFIVSSNQQQPQQHQQPINNSHLRNALLQGVAQQLPQQTQQQQQQTPLTEEAVSQQQQELSKELQGTVVGSTTTPLKSKLGASSTLSSSHATLTALLNKSQQLSGGGGKGGAAPGNGNSSAGSSSQAGSKFRT